MEAVTKPQRQLGKKIGHASNYGVGPQTLSASCLKEMDLVIPIVEAERMLQGRHRVFPGISKWHRDIQAQISRTKTLETPLGRKRIFYDRLGPDLFKEAYAYIPQSTVSDIISQLALLLFNRTKLLLQIHDSILIEVKDSEIPRIIDLIIDQDLWNPELILPGGKLRVPIEIKSGQYWNELEEVYSG